MRRFLVCLLVLFMSLMLTPVEPVRADVGFGIPDMVEEQVDELDEKVKAFKERQPVFDEIRQATVAVSEDTRDVVVGSTITAGSLNNRVFVVLEINRPGDEGIALFESDGEGKPIASELIAEPNNVGDPVFEQVSVSPSDEQVDLLLNIPTDSGPQGLFVRRDADDDLSQPGGNFSGGTGEVVIGSTAQRAGSVDTAVEVNTFSYDADTQDIYLSGDSGVFKVFSGSDGILAPSDWDSRFQGEFIVPEDNLVIDGDKIYLTTLEPAGSGNKDIVMRKLDADSEVLQVDTIATSVSNPRTSLLAGKSHLYLHYYADAVDDWIYKLDYNDLSTVNSTQYTALSSNFQLKVESENRIFGEGTDGKVFGFDKSLPSGPVDRSVSDTKVTVPLVDRNNRLYVGTKESNEGAVFRGEEDLSNSNEIFPPAGEVFRDECTPDLNDRDDVFTRPVWLKQGFLGVVFNRTCVFWGDVNANLPLDGWAHEDGNNQRQRDRRN